MLSRHIKQEVCPWNGAKLAQPTSEPDYLARVPGLSRSQRDAESGTGTHPHSGPSTDAPSLVELMRMSYEEWDVWTRGSAIRRAGYAGFKRNVAVAIGHWLASVDEPPEEAVAVLREALEDEEPLVRSHSAWALGEIGGEEARASLERALRREPDEAVLGELRLALEAKPV